MERCPDPWFTECCRLAESLDLVCFDLRWIENKQVLQVVLGSKGKVENCEISHEDCKRYSNLLMETASFMSEIPDEVGVEVSSPGEELPLRMDVDFAQAIGQKVYVRLKVSGSSKKKVLRGKLEECDGDQFRVSNDRGVTHFSLKEVDLAYVEPSQKLKSQFIN